METKLEYGKLGFELARLWKLDGNGGYAYRWKEERASGGQYDTNSCGNNYSEFALTQEKPMAPIPSESMSPRMDGNELPDGK